MNKCNLSIYYLLLIAIIIVIFINRLSFLNPVIIKNPRLTIWSVTHFITFYIVGKLCPNQYFKFFIMGVLWEGFEKNYGIVTGKELYWTSNGIQGQISDIIMNTLGYHMAHIL